MRLRVVVEGQQPGVAEALVATFAGLAAAIPAVIAYNLYVNRVRLFAGELDGVFFLTIEDDRITAVHGIRNPEKLRLV